MFGVLFAFIPMAIEATVLSLSEAEDWFHYDKIVLSDQSRKEFAENPNTQVLKFYSFAEIKKPVRLVWDDVLYCNFGKGFEFITSNQTSNYYSEPTTSPRLGIDEATGEEVYLPWHFPLNGNFLPSGTPCFIDSTATAELRFDIDRPNDITSEVFKMPS